MAHRQSAAFATDRAYFKARMDEAVTASRLPYPESVDAFAAWRAAVEGLPSETHLLSDLLLEGTAGAHEKAATSSAARRRVTRVVLAVERYRLAHGNALPKALKDLVPEFLDTVPTDPFDGKALRYARATPRGFTVYSIGPDRKDDGGKPKSSGAEAGARFDLPFSVRR